MFHQQQFSQTDDFLSVILQRLGAGPDNSAE